MWKLNLLLLASAFLCASPAMADESSPRIEVKGKGVVRMVMLFSLLAVCSNVFAESNELRPSDSTISKLIQPTLSTERYVLTKKASVEAQVERLIEKRIGKVKLQLDFNKMKCVESGDELEPARSAMVRLGVCVVTGDSHSDPSVTGSFAIIANERGVTVYPILVEAE